MWVYLARTVSLVTLDLKDSKDIQHLNLTLESLEKMAGMAMTEYLDILAPKGYQGCLDFLALKVKKESLVTQSRVH